MKFNYFSYNFSAINILIYFFKIWIDFCSDSNFLGQVLFFVYVFCWKNEYTLGNIIRIWVQKV